MLKGRKEDGSIEFVDVHKKKKYINGFYQYKYSQ